MTEITEAESLHHGLCQAQISLRAHQLLSLVCRLADADCPLIDPARADQVLARLRQDPTVAIRLTSPADQVPHFRSRPEGTLGYADPEELLNRKRDLDVLQKLGLCPGDTRRARYLLTLLFGRISTLKGLCAYDTPGWEGCALARSGAYERVREQGWQSVVYLRGEEEKLEFRRRSAERIARDDRIYLRPHPMMAWPAGTPGARAPSPGPTTPSGSCTSACAPTRSCSSPWLRAVARSATAATASTRPTAVASTTAG